MLDRKRLVIIGGTSGIGLATAKLAAQQGADLVITGFKTQEFEIAKTIINTKNKLEFFQLDISDELAVRNFFALIGEFDYLTTPGSAVPKGPFLTLETDTAKSGFDSKFWGQYYAAKYAIPQMRTDGAIVFFSGVISQRPQANLSIMAAVNSAIEGLGRALAVELAPIRINTVAPGIVDTPRYAGMPEADRQAMFASLGEKLPAGRVGQSEELAQAVIYLLTNTFTTGTTLYVDGGHLLS